jgi:hypothetical protein
VRSHWRMALNGMAGQPGVQMKGRTATIVILRGCISHPPPCITAFNLPPGPRCRGYTVSNKKSGWIFQNASKVQSGLPLIFQSICSLFWPGKAAHLIRLLRLPVRALPREILKSQWTCAKCDRGPLIQTSPQIR